VSWTVAAWSLLGLVLLAGFGWYERSRPPSRVVALVAALAALAVAGRLVLAPIPNVVATTDIVLITGFAVGAGPGFAVGALAALVSNIWLGQGPWTPWQMAGWGMVGIGGAGLAAITGGRLGRVGLAIACGLAGLAYGALLDLSVMVTYGGEQSLDRYLALSARGIPFNLAHAAGNVALALAAGPALLRMISRYRTRFEFAWRPPASVGPAAPARRLRWMSPTLPIVCLLLVALGAVSFGRSSTVGWLRGTQNNDAGFPIEPGGPSSAAMTGWASLGLEAAGVNPLDVRRGGSSPIRYLRSSVAHLRSTGDLERTILVLAGAGVSPRRFGGVDLVARLRERRSPNGSFGGQVNLTAFGILALRAAAAAGGLSRSGAWLGGAQNGDGGWGFQPAAPSDPDSTGAALEGLTAAGSGGGARSEGVRYLREVQRRDGGFPLGGAGASNSQSTAFAVQGLLAAGVNPGGVRSGGRSPFEYLAARRASDGHYRYSASSDQTPVWVTAQALLAVQRKPFPLAAVPRSRHRPGHSGAATTAQAAPGPSSEASAPSPSTAPTREGPVTSVEGQAVRGRGGAAASEAASPQAGGPPAGEPAVAPVASRGSSDDDSNLALYVGVGFAVLTAVLAGGFLWYRRRLP
jgi:energy-coupling factor transport system substrate-specific component